MRSFLKFISYANAACAALVVFLVWFLPAAALVAIVAYAVLSDGF